MKRLSSFLLVVLLAACSPAENAPVGITSAEPLVWPAPPADERIRFLYAFRTPEDLGFRASFFAKLWEFVAGEERHGMIKPYAIAVEGGLIAVADPGRQMVHLFDMDDGEYGRINEAGEDLLVSPVGVTFGGSTLFVADSMHNKVFAFDRDGDHRYTIEGFQRPTGLAWHAATGRLYVADTLANSIVIHDREGRRISSFGGRGLEPGSFNFPTHLAMVGDTLYVNDTMNFRVQAFDPDGNLRSSFGRHGDGSGDFIQPKGLGLDSEGHIYVADSGSDRVQIFDHAGRFLLAFGGVGSGLGRFWLPAGLVVAEDRIYVADTYNGRVQVFEFVGGS